MTLTIVIVAAIVGLGIAQLRHDRAKYAIAYALLIMILLAGLRRSVMNENDFDGVMDYIVVCSVAAVMLVGYKKLYRVLNTRL